MRSSPCRTTMTRSTASRRARNSASVMIEGRRRLVSRPSRRRCRLASIRVEPLTPRTPSSRLPCAALGRGRPCSAGRPPEPSSVAPPPPDRRRGGGACDVGFRSTYRRSCAARHRRSRRPKLVGRLGRRLSRHRLCLRRHRPAPSSPESADPGSPAGRPPRPRRPRRRRVDDRGESSPSASSPGSASASGWSLPSPVSAAVAAAVSAAGRRLRAGAGAVVGAWNSTAGTAAAVRVTGSGVRSRVRRRSTRPRSPWRRAGGEALRLGSPRPHPPGPDSRLPVPSQPRSVGAAFLRLRRARGAGIRRRSSPDGGRRVGRRPGGARRRGVRSWRPTAGRPAGCAVRRRDGGRGALGGRCRLGRGVRRGVRRVVGALVVEQVVLRSAPGSADGAPRGSEVVVVVVQPRSGSADRTEADEAAMPWSAGLRSPVRSPQRVDQSSRPPATCRRAVPAPAASPLG